MRCRGCPQASAAVLDEMLTLHAQLHSCESMNKRRRDHSAIHALVSLLIGSEPTGAAAKHKHRSKRHTDRAAHDTQYTQGIVQLQR